MAMLSVAQVERLGASAHGFADLAVVFVNSSTGLATNGRWPAYAASKYGCVR